MEVRVLSAAPYLTILDRYRFPLRKRAVPEGLAGGCGDFEGTRVPFSPLRARGETGEQVPPAPRPEPKSAGSGRSRLRPTGRKASPCPPRPRGRAASRRSQAGHQPRAGGSRTSPGGLSCSARPALRPSRFDATRRGESGPGRASPPARRARGSSARGAAGQGSPALRPAPAAKLLAERDNRRGFQ